MILNRVLGISGMILGTLAAYALGTAWYCYSTGTGLTAALASCVIPFIPGDLVKIIVAAVVAPTVAKQIRKLG